MLGDLPFGLIIYYGHAPPRLKWPIPRAGRGARPSTVATALILLYPLLYGFFISLFDTNLLSKWEFVFLDNYVSIVEDGELWYSLWITIPFSIGSVILQLIFGFGACPQDIVNGHLRIPIWGC
jgi:hypothetical protein